MLYTATDPGRQMDRIRLFPDAETARASTRPGELIFAVAAVLGEGGRRVIPCWVNPHLFDPAWATPAELHADGSITARGPIPPALFESRHPGCGEPRFGGHHAAGRMVGEPIKRDPSSPVFSEDLLMVLAKS